MQQAHAASLGGKPDDRGEIGCRNARGSRPDLVGHERGLRLGRFDVPIHVDDAGRLFEDRLHLRGELPPTLVIRPVDFGDEGLQHRRAGRHFGHLNRGAESLGNRNQPPAHALRDLMALLVAVVLRSQVHLQVRQVRPTAQKVVPHQAVEVVRRGDAHVALHVRDAGIAQDFGGERGGDACRLFEGRAFRQVHDDLELALVVERQHLDRHELQRYQGHRREKQERHAA